MISLLIVLQRRQFEANQFACEHPTMWTHPAVYWWSGWDFPYQSCPGCPPWWSSTLSLAKAIKLTRNYFFRIFSNGIIDFTNRFPQNLQVFELRHVEPFESFWFFKNSPTVKSSWRFCFKNELSHGKWTRRISKVDGSRITMLSRS